VVIDVLFRLCPVSAGSGLPDVVTIAPVSRVSSGGVNYPRHSSLIAVAAVCTASVSMSL
jgi:hypothetical protein